MQRARMIGLAAAMLLASVGTVQAQTTMPLTGSTGGVVSAGSITFTDGSPTTVNTNLVFSNIPVGATSVTVQATLLGELICPTCLNIVLGTASPFATFINTTVFDAPTNPAAQGGTVSYLLTYRDVNGTQLRVPNGINVTAAPEPGTWALLGTGLLAIGGVGYRRRTPR